MLTKSVGSFITLPLRASFTCGGTEEVTILSHLRRESSSILTKVLLQDCLDGLQFTQENQVKEETPKVKNIFLDVGAKDAKEVEKMGIHVGCVVTYPDKFMVLNKNWYVGRALDNRAGGFMIAEVARMLKENKVTLPFGLYITNSVQEEIGLRGAQMIAERIKPDVAIVTDVCHCTQTPMVNKIEQGDITAGKGPAVTYGPAVQNNLLKRIIETAKENKIDFQRMAASRSTGTDTDAFAYSNCGVPSALISLPLRYMHTTVEMVHKDDIEGCIKLIYETLLKIKTGEDFKYL